MHLKKIYSKTIIEIVYLKLKKIAQKNLTEKTVRLG